MNASDAVVFEAVAFAARAHRNQYRKDGITPYVSHVFRVCVVVRQVFRFDDPQMLAAALLHDTIEDTTTDFDDIFEAFGPDIPRWVSALTKEKRLAHDIREDEYASRLRKAEWQVKVLKLADMYDNLTDCCNSSLEQQKKTLAKSRFYLSAVRDALPPEGERALHIVEQRIQELQSRLTT